MSEVSLRVILMFGGACEALESCATQHPRAWREHFNVQLDNLQIVDKNFNEDTFFARIYL